MLKTEERASLSTRIALVAGALVMALGLIVIIGWHARSRNLVQLHPSWGGMAYNAALAMLMMGLGLIAAARRRYRWALACSGWPILIGILTGIQHSFQLNLGIDELFCKVFYTIRTPYPGRLAQNTALCFFLAGSTLALLSITRPIKGRIPIACVLCAIILAISNLALAGFFVGMVDSYGRGLFMRMAPHTAAGVLVIAIGLIALIFAQSKGQRSIFNLRRAVLGYAVVGTFVVALISSTLAVLPFYARLHEARSQNLLQLTTARAGALERYLAQAKNRVHRISRHRSDLLAQFNRSALNRQEFSTTLTPFLIQMLQDSPELAGITKLSQADEVLLSVGQPIPAELLSAAQPATPDVTVAGPFAIGPEYYVMLNAPVIEGAQRLGADVVLVKFTNAAGMLSEVLSGAAVLAANDRTLLGLARGTQFKAFRLSLGPQGGQITPVEPERDEAVVMQQALRQEQGWLHARHDVGTAVVIAYAPVKGSPWGLVATLAIDEIYFGVGRQLLIVIISIFLLVLCGASVVFLLVRPLTGQIMLHTDELERRIQVQTKSLAAELAERQQAEAALRQSQQQYESLVHSIEGIVWEVDGHTFELTFVSPQAERLLGYPVSRWLAEPQFWANHIHPEDREQVVSFCLRAAQAKEDHQFEYRMIAADGREVWLCDFVTVAVEDNGAVKLRGIMVDITARKQMEQELSYSRERFELAAQGAVDGIWDWNVVTNEDYFSDRWCELLGYEPDELQPHFETWACHLHPADKEAVFAALQAHLEQRGPYDLEYRMRTKSGEYRWFRASGQAKWDATGQPLRMAGSLTDITARKRAEEALRANNEELRLATEKAQTADRLKSAFLATMSHELRTPLNAILGFTGIILQELAGPITAEQRTQLGMVELSGQHLLALINDILDLSKIEAGEMKVSLAPFDLRAAIEKTTATVQPLAHQKGLALRVTVAPSIGILISDQRRVEQVLLNLLNNAIKFTAQGEVALTVEATGTVVRLCIADTGIGIKPTDLPTLFKPFHQLDFGTARYHEGTGLGLTICQRLAALLGGTIQVESEWGKGSVFTFTLPQKEPMKL
jgi:PAS domain S-box-containing protein